MKAHMKVIGVFIACAVFVAVGVHALIVPVVVVGALLLAGLYALLLDDFRTD